jgi:hypothetical protein
MTETATVDRTLADSFPASDPPAWTGGGARVEPRIEPAKAPAQPPKPARPAAGHGVAALAGTVAVALLVPIFVIVLPFVLLARAVMATVTWAVVPRPSG